MMNDMTQMTGRETGTTQRKAEDGQRKASLLPPVDVVEDANGVTVWADLPGVPRDKLDVKVRDGNLSIEAEAVLPVSAELKLQHAEIRAPYFARSFALSPDFDTSKIEANLKDGVLKLTIPRREEARPRRIPVQVG
jgi:HSP20 family molecular chaperone IbpA